MARRITRPKVRVTSKVKVTVKVGTKQSTITKTRTRYV